MFIDSHCHLDKLDLQDVHNGLGDVLQKAREVKVTEMLSVGVTLDSFPKMLGMIEPYSNI